MSARRAVFVALLAAAGVSLALTTTLAVRHTAYKRMVAESSRAHLLALTTGAAAEIDAIVRDTASVANEFAADLTDGSQSPRDLLPRIKATAESRSHFFGVCVTFKPYAFDPKRRLYSDYYARRAGTLQFIQLDTIYDYTRPEYEWFTPVLQEGPRWTQPYYDDAAGTSMITYSTPFYSVDSSTGARTAIGTVSIDISMDEVRRIIESLDLGPSGFGALVSQKGVYLYHPNPELVQARKTLQDVAREQRDRDRLVLAEKVVKRESGILDHRSTTTGQASWLIYAPVASTGWSLQNTFILDDLPLDYDRLRHQLIAITIAALAFGASAVALLAGAYAGRGLWVTSAAIAAMLVVATGSIWRTARAYNSADRTQGVEISDKATLGRLMNAYVRTCAERHTEPPVYVPTGVFIESAYFSTPVDLEVTGYLWQKYTIGAHDGLSRGFAIAEAADLKTTENFRTTENGIEIVRWYFTGRIKQSLDHHDYPLEQERIKLRILHKDLDHNVVLVPDLESYRFANPSAKPGLEKELVFPGWIVTRSVFELRTKPYDTNFGVERSLAKDLFPSLYFTVAIERNFVDAFISNLTALIIVSILLFTLLMVSVRDERLVGYMQAGSGRILSICAAMFFVIAFSHIDIRRKIAAEEVFYLEYFYLAIYTAILWVSVNSVLFAMGARVRVIQYQDNLVSKLLFWPVLLTLIFAVTIYTFY